VRQVTISSYILELRDNFASITNVVSCFLTDGQFDFLFENDLDWETKPFGLTLLRAVNECKLSEELNGTAEHLTSFFRKFEPSGSDILTILSFIKGVVR